mgnify:CR=1 FL=1
MKTIVTKSFIKKATDYNTYPNVKKEPGTEVTNLFLNTIDDDTEEGVIDKFTDPKEKRKKKIRNGNAKQW